MTNGLHSRLRLWAVAAVLACALSPVRSEAAGLTAPTQGQLLGRRGGEKAVPMPLAKTTVRANASLGSAQVVVSQVFVNPHRDPIEAVYVFPLPYLAAVRRADIKIGRRVIRGRIAPRAQVRDAYARARASGRQAVRVDQERPNIFTQSVSKIPGGGRVVVELEYHVPLAMLGGGEYEFSFPMVVAPRSIPGQPDGALPTGGGRLPDTSRVPDASRITPPILPEGMRSGRDIDIRLTVDEGTPVLRSRGVSHRIATRKLGGGRLQIRLARKKAIPNRDFVVRYRVRPKGPTVVVHREPDGSGFLGLTIPSRGSTPKKAGRVVIAIDDTSSMKGEVFSSAKRLASELVTALPASASFAIVPLSSARPLPIGAVSRPRRNRARQFLAQLRARTRRDARPALARALRIAGPAGTVVVVSDGWFGNERELARVVVRAKGRRVFAVAVGAAPNRYFAGILAAAGRGVSELVPLGEDPGRVAARLAKLILSRPTEVTKIGWPARVHSQTPNPASPLYPGRPIRVYARFQTLPANGRLTIRERIGDKETQLGINVSLGKLKRNPALPFLWARQRIAELELDAVRSRSSHARMISKLGTDFGLLTRYTSFIAIDDGDGSGPASRTVYVPVELPAQARRRAVLEDSDIGGEEEALDEKKDEGRRRKRRLKQPALDRDVTSKAPPSPDGFGDDDVGPAETGASGGVQVGVDASPSTEALESISDTSGLRLTASLSVGAAFGRGNQAVSTRVGMGVLAPLGRRLRVGAELSATAPLDSDLPKLFGLAPHLQVRILSRLGLGIAVGPAISSDGDFAGLFELLARIAVTPRLAIELRYQRLLVPDDDADTATVGVGWSF